jgi:hypothetical protein
VGGAALLAGPLSPAVSCARRVVSAGERELAAAADAFLKRLGVDERALALHAFDDENRLAWYYTPMRRQGIAYKQLDAEQRRLGDALVAAGLGARGREKVTTIRSLEPILREIEGGRGPVRDEELYYVTLFGEPGKGSDWAFRFEGHHVSLNFTFARDGRIASTPTFLGANPAEIRHGARKGLRTLAREEDLARELVASLDDAHRKEAVVADRAPAEILSSNLRRAEPLSPAGLSAGKLSGGQRDLLHRLLDEYAATMAPAIAERRMERVRAGGLDAIHFAWAGGLARGDAHYYRIQGPSFLVEYDNTQNDANHIHTVWRDFEGDFGADLLASHYDASHR